MKERVATRLGAVLSAEIPPKEYAHLSADDRLAIRAILRATEPELTAGWTTDVTCEPGK